MKFELNVIGKEIVKDVEFKKFGNGRINIHFNHKIYSGFQYDDINRLTDFKKEYWGDKDIFFKGYVFEKKTQKVYGCKLRVTEL